jgi:predicted O-methyltransferase YrrM
MGSVQFGIPRELTLALKAKYGIERFVETGTLVGHTAMWAAEHFHDVTTVDIEYNREAVTNLSRYERLKQFHVDSAWFLNIYPPEEKTLFWLDAHTNESCPVLKEIESINRSTLPHVILVDDARLFGDLPAWPSKNEVLAALADGGRRTVHEVDDVFVAEPV